MKTLVKKVSSTTTESAKQGSTPPKRTAKKTGKKYSGWSKCVWRLESEA